MGHYDSDFEYERLENAKEARKRAAKQLAILKTCYQDLCSLPGIDGISERHIRHFEDMINETTLRARR